MFHKIAPSPKSTTHPDQNPTQNPAGLTLVSQPFRVSEPLSAPVRPVIPEQPAPGPTPAPFFDLMVIAARRCSAFFAEAAVLVLVFGILDLVLLKGRTELPTSHLLVGALAISLTLLAASIATDFSAQRWIKAHP